MYAAVLMFAVLTHGADINCTNYCKSFFSDLQTGMTWRTDCNCVSKDQNSEIFKYHQRNNDFYYTPEVIIPMQAVTLSNNPFYLQNQVHTTPLDENSNKRTLDLIANNDKGYTDEKSNIHVHNRRIQKNVPDDEDFESFLDLETTRKPLNQGQINYGKNHKRFNLKERNLSECVDLHVLLSSRQCNNLNELKKKVDPNIYIQYAEVSNADLEIEIQNKCSEINNIVEQSLNEIRNTYPRKRNYSLRHESIADKQIRNTHARNFPRKSETKLKMTPKYPKSIVPSSKWANRGTAMSLENVQNIKPITYNNQNNALFNFTQSLEPMHDTTVDSIQQIKEDLTTPSSIELENEESIQNIDLEEEKNNTAPYYSLLPEGELPSENVHFRRTKNLSSQISWRMSEDSTENAKYTTLVPDIITSKKPEKRSEYTEKEIQIPKIITREFPNDTVVSDVNGTENLPNDDFTNTSLAESSLYETNESTTETNLFPTSINENNSLYSKDFTHFYILNNKTNSHKIEIFHSNSTNQNEDNNMTANSQINSKEFFNPNETDITGNLYFLFKDKQVPARFIQKYDGQLHVGLNGFTLCEEISNEGKNKSTVLKALCDYFTSYNNTSTNKNYINNPR